MFQSPCESNGAGGGICCVIEMNPEALSFTIGGDPPGGVTVSRSAWMAHIGGSMVAGESENHPLERNGALSECRPQCAQTVLDTADIVRNGDFVTVIVATLSGHPTV